MLKLRILTALVLIPLVICAVFFLPQYEFALAIVVFVALAAWEWASLLDWHTKGKRWLYLLLIVLSLIIALMLPFWLVLCVGVGWWLAVLVWLVIAYRRDVHVAPAWLVGLAGFLVLVPFGLALLVMHTQPRLLMFFLLIVWIADTAAYFGGRLWGHHPLAPSISPKKTLEGVYTAVTVALLATWFLYPYFLAGHAERWQWLLWVISTVAASIVGDLFESLLKRQQGLKDSGQLLPGHGGILDRIDSLTAAAPIFLCGVVGLHLM